MVRRLVAKLIQRVREDAYIYARTYIGNFQWPCSLIPVFDLAMVEAYWRLNMLRCVFMFSYARVHIVWLKQILVNLI